VLLVLAGCEARDFTSNELEILETLTPLPEPPPDRSNKWIGNEAAIALGKKFYFDTGFSGPISHMDPAKHETRFGRTDISCASCHDPALGGVDRTSTTSEVSIGAGVFNVNAPSTINSAYWDLWFWNGRTDSLWAVGVIANEAAVAFNSSRLAVTTRIYDVYRAEYEAIFGALPDVPPQDDQDFLTRVTVNFAKAIAAYEYTLVVRTSAFDEHMAGGPSMSEEAIRGAKLFIGKAACIECHNTPLFSDRGFHNTGVPETELAHPREDECPAEDKGCDCVSGTNCVPWGAHDGYGRLMVKWNELWRTTKWSDDPSDTSRAPHYTRERTDDLKGAWRTASLRGLMSTAPYMHNGAYRTIEDAIWHYDQGGTDAGSARANKAPEMQPLGLTARDVSDLAAFLEALDGDPLPADIAMRENP
jgi:cytochrome c peroxidase